MRGKRETLGKWENNDGRGDETVANGTNNPNHQTAPIEKVEMSKKQRIKNNKKHSTSGKMGKAVKSRGQKKARTT